MAQRIKDTNDYRDLNMSIVTDLIIISLHVMSDETLLSEMRTRNVDSHEDDAHSLTEAEDRDQA